MFSNSFFTVFSVYYNYQADSDQQIRVLPVEPICLKSEEPLRENFIVFSPECCCDSLNCPEKGYDGDEC